MPNKTYNPSTVIDAARHLLADAAARCHAPHRADPENVHDIRKDLKTVRAYWRLMRHALGKRHSKAGNARCKEAARQLADARDHVVMLETLDDVGRDTKAKTAMAMGQAKQAMQHTEPGEPTNEIDWQRVEDLIRNDDAAWSGLSNESIDPSDVKRSWKRTRRKAARAYRRSRKRPAAQALHDWRKWTKRWLVQEELLHADKAKRIDRLDTLGDLLGRHHDLAILAERLWRNDRFGGKPQKRVRKALAKRRAVLQKQALKLGCKTFA